MEFIISLQEDGIITKAYHYTNGFHKQILSPYEGNLEDYTHNLNTIYLRNNILSADMLFYKMEFPKSIKSNLQYIQIDNFITDTLEQNGLLRSDYALFYRDYVLPKDKKLKTSYIFVIPQTFVNRYPFNELYLVPFFITDLVAKSRQKEAHAVLYRGLTLTMAMIFQDKELLTCTVSMAQDLETEKEMLKALALEKLHKPLEDEQLFLVHEKESLAAYLTFLKLKAFAKTLTKAGHEVDPLLFLSLQLPSAPVQTNNPIKFHLSKRELNTIAAITGGLTLLSIGVAGWFGYRYFQTSEELETLRAQKIRLENEKMRLNRMLQPYTSLKKLRAHLKKIDLPTYPELFYVLEQAAIHANAEVITMEIEKPKNLRRSSKKKKETPKLAMFIRFASLASMEEFEKELQTIPIIDKIDKEFVTTAQNDKVTKYIFALKRVPYEK